MAEEDLDLDVGDAGAEGAPKKSKKMLIMIIAGVLIVILVAIGGMFAMGVFDAPPEEVAEKNVDGETKSSKKVKKEDAEELEDDAIYWPVEPPFVMNFEGRSKAKYMQVGLVVMSRSRKSIDTLKKHMPAIRNELTFLLGSQKYVEMVTPEGKEQLRSEIIETVNTILKANGAGSGIKTALFTSFVMQ